MQSSVFPIFLRAEYRSDGKGFGEFRSEAARAAAAAKAEFQGVGAALDAALSRRRNSGGSLDLGVDELRQAAAAQQQVAAAAREVAEATKRAATANGAFDASLGRAARSAFDLANAEERASRELLEQIALLDRVQAELNQTASATDFVTAANRRGQSASRAAVASQGALRTASVQAGQQLQDIVVQMESGTRATTIFAQQVPQLAFALTGLRESSNSTQAAIGRAATFLAGPWGAAIFAATAVLGPLVAKMFEGEKAADGLKGALDDVRFVTNAMGEAQTILGSVLDLTTGRIKDQTAATVDLARAQLQVELVRARLEGGTAERTLQAASRRRVTVRGSETVQVSAPGAPLAINPTASIPRRVPSASSVAAARALTGDIEGALQEILRLQEAGKTTLEIFGEISEAAGNLGVSRANVQVLENALKALDGDRAALQEFIKPKPNRNNSGADARRAVREAEQLEKFGERAEERIARLNERFDQQPRLIDAAAQATRELDAIIADLQERKPVDFAALVDEAEQVQGVIRDALARPVEDLLQLSEERLQIEGLIAAGRIDEALALREILRLEAEIGELTEQQKDDIRDQIAFEQAKTRELREQTELLDAQANVARTVADSLRDVLSGRSTDFFGDFTQSLRDLQGARLFEDIFGQTFRDLEQELSGNSPQGQANAAYAAEVTRTATATKTAGDAAITLAQAFDQAFGIITGDGTRSLGPANDNEVYQAQIDVTGNRIAEVRLARLSITEVAERISTGISTAIGAELEDVLGPRFASLFGDIVGGAIAGRVTAGNVGAVLGGVTGLLESGVLGNDNRISERFGRAGEGAALGTQIAGLSNLLGIGGSTTGAQIGGALGSLIPIPGGNIIGAIAGSIFGSLISGTPRGSATIGGTGGGLGVTGVVGNRGSLRDASGNLAGSVLEAIDRIAEQLGASVNASAGRVSIGQRGDNLRVDPRGGGATRIDNGARDFGQDAEAAIAFAVRDLIQDGVITGLRASEQRLLRAGSDIEEALRDVLTFRSVFDQLDQIRDPVGAAVRSLNREFEGLIDLFGRAGASADELGDLEELYDIRRAQAIEDATSQIAGSLRQLLDDLQIGDSGLSLRSRRGNALGQFDALAARVAAGDSTAFDDFADISQQLLDIERQLFGSTQSYFDRLAQITALTETAIADQTNVTSIGAAAPSPFDDQTTITRSIDAQTGEITSRLDALIANQIALGQTGPTQVRPTFSGFGSGVLNQAIANF